MRIPFFAESSALVIESGALLVEMELFWRNTGLF